jgi:hypothetical protein
MKETRMRLLLEVDGGYVEVAGDGRLRAAVRECRDAPTKRNGTLIEQLGSEAIAAAADAVGEKFMGVARPSELAQQVEPRR